MIKKKWAEQFLKYRATNYLLCVQAILWKILHISLEFYTFDFISKKKIKALKVGKKFQVNKELNHGQIAFL